MSDLVKDFEAVAVQVNEKIREAAAKMKEARKLANKAGLKALYICGDRDLDYFEISEEEEPDQVLMAGLINIGPLFAELDQAGWSTSSLDC